MTEHELKVHPQFWDALVSGAKPFDVRRDDRKFKVGDTCLLREYDPTFGFKSTTSVRKKILYVLSHEDFPAGLAVGHVVLGFDVDFTGVIDLTLELAAGICEEVESWGLSPTKLDVANSTKKFCAQAIRAQKSDSPERKRHEAKRHEA